MFIDEAQIHVKAGNGGNGCVGFRREKFVPKGGPDGGDGGRGGAVIFIADPDKDTLLDFAGKHHWNAPNGESGMGKKMAGRDGEDLIIRVPVGTLIYDADSGSLLTDLNKPKKKIIIARAGRGGRGNWHFRSPTNQVPRYAEPGTEGQERNLKLELKLIADVGLVGMPNAGKSTLLRAVSAARPKVADYPFTTLDPQLGIVDLRGDRRMLFADLPGLIEGAQSGAGLGHAFLRHIERTNVILHLLDLYPPDGSNPADNYRTIRAELESFSETLAHKRELIVANKLDLSVGDDALEKLRAELPGKEVLAISGVSRLGLEELLEKVWTVVKEARLATPIDSTMVVDVTGEEPPLPEPASILNPVGIPEDPA
jgi:GTP-binding protein